MGTCPDRDDDPTLEAAVALLAQAIADQIWRDEIERLEAEPHQHDHDDMKPT